MANDCEHWPRCPSAVAMRALPDCVTTSPPPSRRCGMANDCEHWPKTLPASSRTDPRRSTPAYHKSAVSSSAIWMVFSKERHYQRAAAPTPGGAHPHITSRRSAARRSGWCSAYPGGAVGLDRFVRGCRADRTCRAHGTGDRARSAGATRAELWGWTDSSEAAAQTVRAGRTVLAIVPDQPGSSGGWRPSPRLVPNQTNDPGSQKSERRDQPAPLQAPRAVGGLHHGWYPTKRMIQGRRNPNGVTNRPNPRSAQAGGDLLPHSSGCPQFGHACAQSPQR